MCRNHCRPLWENPTIYSRCRSKGFHMESMSIGRLAELSGVKVTTIRYYESIGLIAVPLRTGGNRRTYGQADIDRLTFIRRSREFGLSMDAIRNLLALEQDIAQPCQAATQIAEAYLSELEVRIRNLEVLRNYFRKIIDKCRGYNVENCTILKELHGNNDDNP
ncbi:hypothetical protein CCP1ISM_880002 [Azospirillaceae bacterium]